MDEIKASADVASLKRALKMVSPLAVRAARSVLPILGGVQLVGLPNSGIVAITSDRYNLSAVHVTAEVHDPFEVVVDCAALARSVTLLAPRPARNARVTLAINEGRVEVYEVEGFSVMLPTVEGYPNLVRLMRPVSEDIATGMRAEVLAHGLNLAPERHVAFGRVEPITGRTKHMYVTTDGGGFVNYAAGFLGVVTITEPEWMPALRERFAEVTE